ncbi:MAG: prolyl-tRNA synthetase associated domain-containing protein [Rhodospirillales bacterium]
MAATPEDLFKRLDELGVTTTTHDHPPLFTVEDSKARRGDLNGGHCKNLFLKDKKGVLWLVVTLEDRPIDMKDLRGRIGSNHLSFGKPELLAEALGVDPGAVTPFALINDPQIKVNVVLDKQMMGMELLNYHPLVNTKTTQITPQDLLAFIASCGHKPSIVEL